MVPDRRVAAKCPDGYGSENSVLLVRNERSFWGRHFPFATVGDTQIPEIRGEEIAFCLPAGQRAKWEAILDRGLGAGLEKTGLERALARLAAANVSPEKAEMIFGPLLAHMEAGEQARQVFLEIEEGLLKGVSFEALVHSVFTKNDLFLRARKDLLETDAKAMRELPSELQASLVAAMETGLSEAFVRDIIAKGNTLHSDKTKYILNALQLLHHAGLEEKELKMFVRNCFEKNPDLEEMDGLVRHIMEKLGEGVDGETIFRGSRV